MEENQENEIRPARRPRVNVWNIADAQRGEDVRVRIAEMEQNLERMRNRPRRNGVGVVLDTIGIELESIALGREFVGRLLAGLPDGLGNNFKVHRDGSSEMNIYSVGIAGNRNNRVIVNAHTKAAEDLFHNSVPQSTIGYELISNPMDIDTAELSLWALLPRLEMNGDFISERCATHVHVGAMKNLGFLKNSLALGLWFDEVLYALAHLDGDIFRGYSNNANYARPLVNGPHFHYDGNFYQVLNWEQALDSQNIYEFFTTYGIDLENGELPKYHPARYFGINLYSVPRIGTLEFRHFNQSFNPSMVSAVSKVCQMFVEIAMKGKQKDFAKLEPGDTFSHESSSHYINKLYKFIGMANDYDCEYSLEKEDIYWLERIIMQYRGIGIKDTPVMTHCRDFNISMNTINEGHLLKCKVKPAKSSQVDIHNIKYQSIIK